MELSYFLVCQLIAGTPPSLPVRWLWGGEGRACRRPTRRECSGISREAFSYPLALLQPGAKGTPPTSPGITVHLPTLTTSHTCGKTQPATGRSSGRSAWRFTPACPASSSGAGFSDGEHVPAGEVTASLRKAESLPATFLTGLVSLSTPSLPAAETLAPRGRPRRKVTERITLMSEPATESSLQVT